MLPPTTSIDEATGDLKINWIKPNENGSSITDYTIDIKDYLGSPILLDNPSCDTDSQPVLTSLTCQISMAYLRAELPYNLPFDTLVEVRISSTNIIGTQISSSFNTEGAKIRTEPNKAANPVKGPLTN